MKKWLYPLVLLGCVVNIPVQAQINAALIVPTVLSVAMGGVAGEFVQRPLIGAAVAGGLALWAQTAQDSDVHKVRIDDELLLVLSSDQLFETNTAHLTPRGQSILDSTVSVLKNYPHDHIHISANVDPIAHQLKWKHLPLSSAQAQEVAGYLWQQGIHRGPTHRMLTYCGNEADYPIATNKKLSGMARNRRIQIIVYPKTLRDYPYSAPHQRHALSSWYSVEDAKA